MLFNSSIFIFAFLPLAFAGYFLLCRHSSQTLAHGFLVLASLFFYSWWNVVYLPLIVGSMVVNFYLGQQLRSGQEGGRRHNRWLLISGVVANLGLLGYFKYTDFFLENLSLLSDAHFEPLNLALPLAISFFTFQQIAYLVDSYRGETEENNFLTYAVFVSFFPQLIAGPIVHHKEMMPQFANQANRHIIPENIVRGLFIFAIGLFKKVIIADSFAVWANAGFADTEALTIYQGWATSWSYTFQLYFDFSGYTDMAIGLALLFNIVLPLNFNSPYKARDIQDFWRRWHMTLSRFLRDYVYIPLGGNRHGRFSTYRNLMATFVLGGIWHGAGWTFVFWGVLHGLALCVHRLWHRLGLRLWGWLGWLITINFVNLAWVFFRAENWGQAINLLRAMFGMSANERYDFSIQFVDTLSRWLNTPVYDWVPYRFRTVVVPEQTILACVLMLAMVLVFRNNNRFIKEQLPSTTMMWVAAVLFGCSVIQSVLSTTEVFLYFNF
ncbi:MBOAT family O-acyltransferase [Marinicella sediminis]|uniref:Probable alginate O-acetylase n=1 Tax=Marinicella sediminis TaxID=1792834 RepID=A0ABV7J9Z5_9GAMM|nr:MBOAT family protein [Marinicella sediminis]